MLTRRQTMDKQRYIKVFYKYLFLKVRFYEYFLTACKNGNKAIVDLLLKNKSKVNEKTELGYTALYFGN